MIRFVSALKLWLENGSNPYEMLHVIQDLITPGTTRRYNRSDTVLKVSQKRGLGFPVT